MFKGEELAVKIICRDKLPEDIKTKFLPRELEILTEVRHPNIIHVCKIFVYPRRTFIFMELIQRGDLLRIMRVCMVQLFYCEVVNLYLLYLR